MKKLFRNETSYEQLEKDYERVKRIKKRIGVRTFLLVLFLFGVNVFAWFVYISEAQIHTDANVAAWDLNFYDGSALVKNVVITPEIYPGMQSVEKTITITNASDTGATVVWTPKDIYFGGQRMFADESNSSAISAALADDYPFKVAFSSTKINLDYIDSADFTVQIYWPFNETNKYYKVIPILPYTDDWDYYTLSGSTYSKATVTSSTYSSMVNNLYMVKDDIDSYIGEFCGDYEASHSDTCFNFTVGLRAVQNNS